ncbi:Ig-like domain-containing protein [Rubricoccus marinus]|uniref:SbsA Ig-like domain-containing protein n=1 Tax=Rubricoccus marinus TaxID=716817 RepID=A0A259U037_9BACT|nr:Ig-like domain-containing protein [Rubricoccus marinus]OZC03395.1 hypothetical protein BSZ36_10630 [Rubricoccus marinus]
MYPHALVLALRLLAFLLALAAAGCATPVPPTGGPADTTPPALVSSSPEAGAVRVASGEIVLTFSERLDAAGARAVQVTPEAETPPEVEIRGREVRITLDSLREATTYVVTVTTDLRDARRVALRAPITLAFATGDELDRAQISGRVLLPQDGTPASGVAVWAYAADSSGALPDPSQRPPDYQTETGADGAFSLEYLRRGTFFVAAVQDANRNRRADPGEAFALPARPLATADTTEAAPLALYLASADSLAPEPQRARGLSDQRLAVRFSELVRLGSASPEAWALADSASGARVPIRAVYVDPISPQEVRLVASRPLANVPHQIAQVAQGVVTDSTGNGTAAFSLTFTPPARPDTVTARFAGFVPSPEAPTDSVVTLRPGVLPGVRFTAPPDSAALDAVSVTGASTDEPLAWETSDGLTFRFLVSQEATAFTLRAGDSTQTQRYRRLAPSETGALVGSIVDASGGSIRGASGETVLIEALPASGEPYRTTADASGRFAFPALPPGEFRVRFVVDRDGDGAWTGGRLAPYAAPETLAFASGTQTIRARFETDMGEIDLGALALPEARSARPVRRGPPSGPPPPGQ